VSKRIFVTGGTGAIGIPLVQSLLQRGDHVYTLVRAPNQRRLLATFGNHPRLTVLTGDVRLPCGGLTPSQLSELTNEIDVFAHGAAIVQFHHSMHEQMTRVNVDGTRNMLELNDRLRAPRFLHISTAYVAGKRGALGESDWGRPEDAQNPYELTKQEAEQLVSRYTGADVTILRLATVVGDASTGRTAGFGGIFGFVQSIWVHRNRLAECRNHPVLVRINPDSTLNLVTAEWVNQGILAVLDASHLPVKVLHFSNPEPPTMRFLFTTTFHEVLQLPVEFDSSKIIEPTDSPRSHRRWSAVQRAIDRAVIYFGNYLQQEPRFAFGNLQRHLGLTAPPSIDRLLLGRILSYAQAEHFGRSP
jgi:nucleoside-diphosphate-sugar epimerase